MGKYLNMLSAITMAMTIASSTQVAYASTYEETEFYNKRKILEMNFDEDNIKNTVNNKVYTTKEGKETYEPGSKNKGLKPNGDKIEIPLSDLDIKKQDELTFSFWMKWDGKKDMFMPIGFEEYSLYFIEGSFGFNTNNDDVYGVKDKIKPNELTHVVAVFNKEDITKNKLYLNGVKQELSQVRGEQFLEKMGWNDKLVISGYSYDDQYGLDGTSILDEINLYNGGADDKEVNDLYLMSKVPDLQVTQNNLHARTDWATEILDTDVLWKTSFEDGDMIPRFANDKSNKISNKDSFLGEKSLSVLDGGLYDKGNFRYPATDNFTSRIYFPGILGLQPGMKFTANFRMKNEGETATTTFIPESTHPTKRSMSFAKKYGFKTPLIVSKDAVNSNAIELENFDAFAEELKQKHGDKDFHYFLASRQSSNYEAGPIGIQRKNIDFKNKKIKFDASVNYKKGEELHYVFLAYPLSLGNKIVPSGGGWITYNLNGEMKDLGDDYDIPNKGLAMIVETKNKGQIHMDDIKIGFATKVELQRDNKKIYEGYNSSFEDMNAIDKEKPGKVNKAKFIKDGKSLQIEMEKPKDKGTTYNYKIRGLSEKGITPFSENKPITIVSGVKGYSYVIDKNAVTEPNNTLNTTSEKIAMNSMGDGKHYLHIKTIDNQGNVSETAHIPIEIPTLEAKANHKENMVQLTWDGGKSEPFTYKVFKKKEGEKEFQSISATDYNKEIRVLNVYPKLKEPLSDDQKVTFTNWKGETTVIDKSASLKMWMENPNKEDAKGYGKGLIDVTPVSSDEFNANPEKYLKDEKGNWKYDVLYEGAWDVNNRKDLSLEGVRVVKEFIESGRGYLGGHDVFWKNYLSNRLALTDYMHILPNSEVPIQIGNSKIKINKKGLFTNYPWKLGDVGTILNIPFSHTTDEFGYGDTWYSYVIDNDMQYSDPKWTKGIPSPEKHKIYTEYKGKEGTNLFYLQTWNNTAQIQTGHSNGKATSDEQKILANTLFYLAQLTSDTKLDDRSGQDVNAPTKPSMNQMILNGDGTVNISYKESQDRGTTYDYYVEANGGNTGSKLKSNTVSTEVKAGLKGYSIVIDENPNTQPDSIVETSNTSLKMNAPNTKDFYVHIAGVDNAGNLSEVEHYHYVDKLPPEITITQNTKDWTNKEVVLTVVVTDKDSKVMRLRFPNGDWINDYKATYIVKENGIYFFQAVDQGGNETVQSIVVSNIDKKNPKADISAPENWMNRDVEVKIVGTDE
ncbi:TPA: LamG-like jellyroll fold domain-containing protein [Bacillus paranthracis]